jgi:hypothetical protein
VADIGGRHEDHDPARIAALLDRELDPAERASAEAIVAACPSCAALYDDLRSLARAAGALPTVARTRDFRLTAADAARLAGVAGEPVATTSRLTKEMTDPRTTAAHATHDPILVAALTDRSPTATERAAAEALVAGCSLCAQLHADLVALRAAARAMPTPARPRDYVLTPADAARLRPSGWRRLVSVFGTARDGFSRPLAVGLTTLGLAGLLVTTVPSMLTVGSATSGGPSAAQDSSGGISSMPATVVGAAEGRASSVPAPLAPGASAIADLPTGPPFAAAAPSAAAAAVSPAPAAAASNGYLGGLAVPPQTPLPEAGTTGSATKTSGGVTNDVAPVGEDNNLSSRADTGASTPLVLSGVLLLAGLGLFLLRWVARRTGR